MTVRPRPGSRDDPRRWERGIATVEAVLVVPLVLVPVLLAVVVLGRLSHTRLVLDAAAAAGARQAAVVGGDSALVRSRIATELSDGGLDPSRARIVVEPGVAAWGEPIRVQIAIDEQAAIPFAGKWAVPLEAAFVTRSEVTR
ncbi:MAG: pilus assembly protein [Chloroflexi bacterium]|nr:pilus assembly protein [Chloroflexota bacterium]